MAQSNKRTVPELRDVIDFDKMAPVVIGVGIGLVVLIIGGGVLLIIRKLW